jgi:hypothetical protein
VHTVCLALACKIQNLGSLYSWSPRT